MAKSRISKKKNLKLKGWHTVQRTLASGSSLYLTPASGCSPGFIGFNWNELHYLYDKDSNVVKSKWRNKITSMQVSMLPKETQELISIIAIAQKRVMATLMGTIGERSLSMSEPPEKDNESPED